MTGPADHDRIPLETGSDLAPTAGSAGDAELRELAYLARLRLESPAAASALRSQVDRLLTHFAKLQEVDTEGVPPSAYPMEIPHRLRADVPEEPLSQETVLKNAPASRAGCFLVPRVIEG